MSEVDLGFADRNPLLAENLDYKGYQAKDLLDVTLGNSHLFFPKARLRLGSPLGSPAGGPRYR